MQSYNPFRGSHLIFKVEGRGSTNVTTDGRTPLGVSNHRGYISFETKKKNKTKKKNSESYDTTPDRTAMKAKHAPVQGGTSLNSCVLIFVFFCNLWKMRESIKIKKGR